MFTLAGDPNGPLEKTDKQTSQTVKLMLSFANEPVVFLD